MPRARQQLKKQMAIYLGVVKMPMGKGTYGSKVGRPSKAAKKDPKLKKAAMKKMMAAKRK